jgi:hypothetical protein
MDCPDPPSGPLRRSRSSELEERPVTASGTNTEIWGRSPNTLGARRMTFPAPYPPEGERSCSQLAAGQGWSLQSGWRFGDFGPSTRL